MTEKQNIFSAPNEKENNFKDHITIMTDALSVQYYKHKTYPVFILECSRLLLDPEIYDLITSPPKGYELRLPTAKHPQATLVPKNNTCINPNDFEGFAESLEDAVYIAVSRGLPKSLIASPDLKGTHGPFHVMLTNKSDGYHIRVPISASHVMQMLGGQFDENENLWHIDAALTKELRTLLDLVRKNPRQWTKNVTNADKLLEIDASANQNASTRGWAVVETPPKQKRPHVLIRNGDTPENKDRRATTEITALVEAIRILKPGQPARIQSDYQSILATQSGIPGPAIAINTDRMALAQAASQHGAPLQILWARRNSTRGLALADAIAREEMNKRSQSANPA